MQLHFLPWAGEVGNRTIGPVTLTPWVELRTQLDEKPRAFFDHYFTRYLDHGQRPVEHVTIASITPDPLADITASQRSTIRSAVDALTFASIIPDLESRISSGNHFGTPNSERFQLITQLTDLRPGIAVSTRGVLHAWGTDQIHFCMPWVAGTDRFRTDDDLLTALGRILSGDVEPRSRLYRTIEWFRLAHTGSPETSDESRVVMMCTAFETLLEPDNPHEKSGPIALRLHELTYDKDFATTIVPIGKATYNLNPIAAWFCAFYSLRNKVIHGDGLSTEDLVFDDRATQLDVADLVLWEAISWELVERNLLGQKALEDAEWFSQTWDQTPATPALTRQIMSGLTGINVDRYHQRLGWTTPSRD